MEWNDWIGKIIFVKLKDGSVYSGKCLDCDKSFLNMIDKFGSHVVISIDDINKLVDESK